MIQRPLPQRVSTRFVFEKFNSNGGVFPTFQEVVLLNDVSNYEPMVGHLLYAFRPILRDDNECVDIDLPPVLRDLHNLQVFFESVKSDLKGNDYEEFLDNFAVMDDSDSYSVSSAPKFDLGDLFNRNVRIIWTSLGGLETEIAVALDDSPLTEKYPSLTGEKLVPFQKVIDDWVPGLNVEERIKELLLVNEDKYAVTSSESSKGAYTDEHKRLDALIVMAGV